ncbi:Glucose/arabinose dehydrogenase, beta-propeller fold [Salinimicrobium catena]|uniref:Glucose/arabinose dehydrogenase, beta-propeller fold n=1 Tax=Salinimicrobium catena TaxID=390640 RepID=A0A1H5HTN3_9FLAO|nr:PQQ-dependent sugar dehydrogenase [Salinimicrobium catena]SDK72194.1 Glucose/arabinose dehydrogenase, beta-propeller fold [Salinimicrobium catena]SEE30628.1 Glucose/arabinose dehydrogenase, beta-propeller fold [Salinimicrobium catena]
MRGYFWYLTLSLFVLLQGCANLDNPTGGGQLNYDPGPRQIDPADILVPDGYNVEVVARGLTFPTAVTENDEGQLFAIESGYAYGEIFLPPRLLKISEDGSSELVLEGAKNGPWTGITYNNGYFYVAEGGQMEGGKILRIDSSGDVDTLVENLPSLGDHHTNGPVIKDGEIYFGQGTATNSAVVGPDNAAFGWLSRKPQFHDIPCKDIVLKGINYTSENPLTDAPKDSVSTGAYVPFGQSTRPGQVIAGSVPCNGAIMKIPLEGGEPELVAWGLRNPYGIAFSGTGELFVTENSYDVRGSRPVWGTGDVLWKIKEGAWHGWPDYNAGHEISHMKVPDKGAPKLLLEENPYSPPHPIAELGVHSSSNGMDIARNGKFGFEGEVFIAQFGDMAPNVGKVMRPVGYKVVRVNPGNGVVENFAVNKGKGNGPATFLRTGGLERPVSVQFNREGDALYIVDFGILNVSKEEGAKPRKGTGVIWKISKE